MTEPEVGRTESGEKKGEWEELRLERSREFEDCALNSKAKGDNSLLFTS